MSVDREFILEADKKYFEKHPHLNDDFPPCPSCGHKFQSHWDGGIPGIPYYEFSGTSLSWDEGDNGDQEEIICPNCMKLYVVTQHVERIVTRTAHVPGMCLEGNK